jgi:hypothetical protein
MSTKTQTWDFEGYWNTVIGSNRTPESTVAEFGFEDQRAIRDWLDASEKAAIAVGNSDDFPDGRPDSWDAHNATLTRSGSSRPSAPTDPTASLPPLARSCPIRSGRRGF